MKKRSKCLLPILLAAGTASLLSQTPAAAPELSDAEKEAFLKDAKVFQRRDISVGVTGTKRFTLEKNGLRHDAHIQTVNISKPEFRSDRGVELNFRDTYKFNIAAYRLSRLLGLNMMPVTIERKVDGASASVAWWIDNAMMEGERKKKNLEPPDQDAWNRQMYCVRVFDELIYDMDPNLGNFLIDRNWKLWMVDKTRAFRLMPSLKTPQNLVKCDRTVLAGLRRLDEPTLTKEMASYLTKSEVKALLQRRDKIVKFFDDEVAKKGESAVLFDLPKHALLQ